LQEALVPKRPPRAASDHVDEGPHGGLYRASSDTLPEEHHSETWAQRHGAASGSDGKVGKSSKELWKKAGQVTSMVKVQSKLLGLHSLVKNTAFMKQKTEEEQKRFVMMTMLIIVVTGAATAMTKSAMFHISAVGLWDNGNEYKFGYALTLTMVLFVVKMLLIILKWLFFQDEDDHEDEGCKEHASETGIGSSLESEEEDTRTLGERIRDATMPWILLVSFTFFEMLSGTTASLGLLFGAPTSVFVVFKASKTIFLAILSVIILKRKLNFAQWSSLVFISLALLMATFAEGGAKKGSEQVSLIGPALLLLSELFHAFMLVLQEISVREYWTDPLELLSASACIGVVMTGMAMYKFRGVWIELPDGGRRPASDPEDSFYMCWMSPILMTVFVSHLIVHVGQDVAHIVILKHISALARTLCDAVKLILMWMLGKVFWLVGIFPILAEAWHPGLIGSWLMLPAIAIIIYSMLMFKNARFCVFRRATKGDGSTSMEREKSDGATRIKTDLEEPFLSVMFRGKMAKTMKKRHIQTRGGVKRTRTTIG